MNQYLKILLFIFITIISLTGFSQQPATKTLQLSENATSPKATLAEVEWIQGHWKGEAFGGITEEIWSPPLGDSMMFVFRLINDNKVQFYEVGGIRQVNETLLMQLKHFHGDFKGWEEKDKTIDFKLVKIEDDKVYFEGLTFEKISDNEMNVYVVIDEKEGKIQEVKFNYKN
ncbi:MAG: DUF6265 family protein [Aureibaculum sp.]|nr:DUF6265 family protein [Aureibaculum sp.]